MKQGLKDQDSYVRRVATYTLGEIGSEAPLPELIEALNDEDFKVRIKAIEALGKIGSDVAVTALLKASKQETSEFCVKAVEALCKIGTEAVIPSLIKALEDEKYPGRWQVAEALGKIGSETVIPSLIQALRDENFSGRWKVAEALGKISGAELLFDLTELLYKTSESSLLNAVSAIQERCRYYNYALATSPPPQEETNAAPLSHTLNTLNQTLKTMSEAPKIQMTFNDKVYGAAGNIQGDMIVNPPAQSLDEVAEEIQQLLDQLEQANPTTTEAELIVARAIERQPMLQDPQVIQQAIKSTPTLKQRLRSAGKAAYFEIVKVLLPPLGVAIEAINAWKKPEE
jgi:HEAT repeat protein